MIIAVQNDVHYGFQGKRSRKVNERFVSNLATAIEKYKIDAFAISGDIAISEQKEIEAYFKLLRTKIKIPILVVFGNHDYWDDKYVSKTGKKMPARNAKELMSYHNELCEKYDVHYLGNGCITIGDTLVSGYDGWYNDIHPATNDLRYMSHMVESCPVHLFMNYRAFKDFKRVLAEAQESIAKTKICISHFDTVPDRSFNLELGGPISHLRALGEEFDYIFYGHSHRYHDIKKGTTVPRARILSAGGGYMNVPIRGIDNYVDNPLAMVLDTEKDLILEVISISK